MTNCYENAAGGMSFRVPRRGRWPRGVWRMKPLGALVRSRRSLPEGVHSMSFRPESFSRRTEWRNPGRFTEDEAPSAHLRLRPLDPFGFAQGRPHPPTADSARGEKTFIALRRWRVSFKIWRMNTLAPWFIPGEACRRESTQCHSDRSPSAEGRSGGIRGASLKMRRHRPTCALDPSTSSSYGGLRSG